MLSLKPRLWTPQTTECLKIPSLLTVNSMTMQSCYQLSKKMFKCVEVYDHCINFYHVTAPYKLFCYYYYYLYIISIQPAEVRHIAIHTKTHQLSHHMSTQKITSADDYH